MSTSLLISIILLIVSLAVVIHNLFTMNDYDDDDCRDWYDYQDREDDDR